jgi:hypothetical protein
MKTNLIILTGLIIFFFFDSACKKEVISQTDALTNGSSKTWKLSKLPSGLDSSWMDIRYIFKSDGTYLQNDIKTGSSYGGTWNISGETTLWIMPNDWLPESYNIIKLTKEEFTYKDTDLSITFAWIPDK